MLFSDAIPEKVLENSNTRKFCNVLDALHTYKLSRLNQGLKFYNPLVSMNTRWIIKALEDYGFFGIPDNYPVEPLLKLYLNVNNVVSLKGSKRGLSLWLNVMTLGDVYYDDFNVRTQAQFLILDSLEQGYVTSDMEHTIFYLVSDSDLTPVGTMPVIIRSIYFDNPEYPASVTDNMKEYLSKEILNWVGFSDFLRVNFTFSHFDSKIYDELLNTKFI